MEQKLPATESHALLAADLLQAAKEIQQERLPARLQKDEHY